MRLPRILFVRTPTLPAMSPLVRFPHSLSICVTGDIVAMAAGRKGTEDNLVDNGSWVADPFRTACALSDRCLLFCTPLNPSDVPILEVILVQVRTDMLSLHCTTCRSPDPICKLCARLDIRCARGCTRIYVRGSFEWC